MKNKFVDTKDYTYATLCSRYEKFSMPHNQRPYAWKNTQVNDLWEAIVENEEGYFIGNLVCLNPSDDSGGSLVIIDGQQRLTTISLFLIGFKYILNDWNKSKTINELINLVDSYLFWRNPRTQDLAPRLIPGKDNLREIFDSVLNLKKNEGKLDDNQLRYFSNLKYILNIIRKETRNRKEEELDLLIRKILSVQFIAIVVDSENDIYDLFEGLNSTGLGLSVADLLKNAVLKSAPTGILRNNIESNWIQIENLFENTRTSLFPKFLRHYWISNRGYINSSKLFKTIKKEKIERKTGAEVDIFTRELLSDAQIYIGLKFEEYENNLSILRKKEKEKKLLRAFRYLGGLDQVYEVLLALYRKLQSDKKYNISDYKLDVQRLLNFAILAKFVSINPSEYEKNFALICEYSAKYTGLKYKKETGKIFKKIFTHVNKKEEFSDNFSSNLEYGSGSKLIEFLISELMRNYCREDRGIDILEPNIEHILPQNPKKWGLSKEQVSTYVNKIGNLTILHDKDNNDAGNEPMDKKVKEIYLKSKFKFNRDLKKYAKIFNNNPEEAIRKRGVELGDNIFNLLKIL
ncbi:MAG: DUF262 domain-containing HNH endonuclease family protein [Parcubacteria group bacterium]|jgi:uncharacterized protein with ParB-like and HNH nuclease domain|nr:DUF262 domain-containing HNH endonuclease family protein [Candidatus Moranbacteria bacterium]